MSRGVSLSACLKGASFRHCFVSFPHHWRAFIAPASIPTFKLETCDRCLVVSWAGHTHDHDHEGDEQEIVYISSKLLRVNGFADKEMVLVRQIPCPSPCTNASMSTITNGDWEELLLNVESAQEALLTQFRVIMGGQILVLWLEGGAFIFLKIHKLSSSSLGLLQLNTQVQILPPSQSDSSCLPLSVTPSSKNSEMKHPEMESKKSIWNMLYSVFILLGYGNKEIGVLPKQELFLGLKAVPYSPPKTIYEHNVFLKMIKHHPNCVILSQDVLKHTKYERTKYFVSKISKINKLPQDSSSVSSLEDSPSKTMYAIVVVWDELKQTISEEAALILDVDLLLRHTNCILSHSLAKKIALHQNDIIVLETTDCSINRKCSQIDAIILDTCTKDKNFISTSLLSLFTELSNSCPMVLNDSNIIKLDIDDQEVHVSLSVRDGKSVCLEKTSLPQISINVESSHSRRSLPLLGKAKEVSFDPIPPTRSTPLINDATSNHLLHLIKHDLNLALNPAPLCPQFIMLQGSKGCGKTTLVEDVVRTLSGMPYFVHCQIIRLKLLKGKKVDSVKKVLKSCIRDALCYQPSLIVLDDLDFLAPGHSSVEEEKGASFEHLKHMCFMIKCLLVQLINSIKRNARSSLVSKRDFVSVVSTCCARSDVHSLLSSPNGNHLFPKSVHITPLSGETRLNIITSLLEDLHQKFLEKNNICRRSEETCKYIFQYTGNDVMAKLDGLTLPDINTLALRIFLEAKSRWKQDYKTEIENHFIETDDHSRHLFNYSDQDVTKAFNGFVSLSSKALTFSRGPKEARRIGGLRRARESLEEMILWPSQHPRIFSQAKMRLRAGILLYGPPGCGKTLLANSFKAGNHHLNFITIKGPELLSKYIGQSEKSVRDVFQRAECARPCVLFFDEFESIAPRRGHDNTGVTDRVVNQLLTQMDGVEGLRGVYVIAATSRPDLIDPALLRPGRLDKGIYCPMPDQEEREEILKVLSEELTFSDSIDFKEIASRTEGFTGADLHSLLSTAQMKAAQQVIGEGLYEGALEEEESVEGDSPTEEFIRVSFDDYGMERNLEETNNEEKEKEKDKKEKAKNKPRYWNDHKNGDDVCIAISSAHVQMGLDEVTPSISAHERTKYEALHKMFSSEKECNIFARVEPGNKETLA